MIEKIKKSWAGKALYRLSRRSTMGRPLQWLARVAQSEALQPDHMRAAHRAHNRTQRRILAEFVARGPRPPEPRP